MTFLKKLEPVTLLALRLGLSIVFIYHGYPKLFGDTGKFVEAFRNLGLPPFVVYLTGAIEVLGGVALALGIFTSVAGLLLLLDMAAALWKYNFNEGFYAVREYELPLILGLASLAIAVLGAGPLSLDDFLFRKTTGSDAS